MSQNKIIETVPFKFTTYKQGNLKLDGWPTESGNYVEVEYIDVKDLSGKTIIHCTMEEFVARYLKLKTNNKKLQAMFARTNMYRKQYKTRLNAYEKG